MSWLWGGLIFFAGVVAGWVLVSVLAMGKLLELEQRASFWRRRAEEAEERLELARRHLRRLYSSRPVQR